MSTPLSDAVRCMVHAFPDAGRKADVRQIADKIAELERENAELRAAIDESEWFARAQGQHATVKVRELLAQHAALKAHADRVNDANDRLVLENARLRMELDASCNAEELRQVRTENATLREDKNRLDWLEANHTHRDPGFVNRAGVRLFLQMASEYYYPPQHPPTLRAAIDAARKEAHP